MQRLWLDKWNKKILKAHGINTTKITIEDQGKKQGDALEKLKTKETKPIEDKPNNQLKAATIFNDLINKIKEPTNK